MRAGSKVGGSSKARQRKTWPVDVPPPVDGAVVLVAAAAGAVVLVAAAAGAVVLVAWAAGAAGVAVGFSPPHAASEGISNRNSVGAISFFLENILSSCGFGRRR